jgi:hypothetical protein
LDVVGVEVYERWTEFHGGTDDFGIALVMWKKSLDARDGFLSNR